MQIQVPISSKNPRLYTIEFLRIFFVFFIILGHIMEVCTEIETEMLSFLHTTFMQTWFGVEFFFIMGGFFLYKRIKSVPIPFDLIKKIYVRLLPSLLFVFGLCCMSKTVIFSKFPSILFLSTGLTIPGEVTGWGDWYVGVYFWCSLLFIGLFHNNIKQGFLWTAILSYIALCLKFNAPYWGWMKTYYTVIGNQLIRGIYSMGIGLMAAYLSEKIQVSKQKSLTCFFTVIEAYFLMLVFNYIARSSHSHVNFLEMEIIFAMLLISIENSLGYISRYLNKFSPVWLISRYSYPIFLGHIPFIKYLSIHRNLELSPLAYALIVGAGGVVVGIIEYHFVEKKIVPWIRKFVIGEKNDFSHGGSRVYRLPYRKAFTG